MEPIEQQLTQLVADHKSFVAKIDEQLKTVGTVHPETKSQLDALREEMGKLHVQLDAVDAKSQERMTQAPAEKSIGQLVTEHKDFVEAKKYDWRGAKGTTIHMDHGAFPGGTPAARIANNFALKSNITNTGLGFGSSGISMPAGLGAGPLPIAQIDLRLRDVMNVQPIDTNMYMWVRQTTRTNAASPQVEAGLKAESTYAWDTQSGTIKTIAHYTNVSRQALDDINWLRGEIDGELMYGLLLKEEQEILAGSGTGEHLNGIITQATAYNTGLNVSGDTGLDKLRHAKLQARLAGLATFRPTAIVLNPTDMATLELIKDQASNVGNYVIGDPKTGTEVKFVWGLPVVESDSITAGQFLVGAFATAATLIDRMKATVDISFEHDLNFTKNLATILAEERIGLAVKRPTAFIYGAF